MGLNDTPRANRIHIGFFGRRNSGKSSLVNAVTGQDLAVVSPIKGTTTDPVYKAMELLPLGPVVIIDTPGIDDEGALGDLRVRKSRQVLNKIHIAVLVIDALVGKTDEDEDLIRLFEERDIKHIVVYNKADLLKEDVAKTDNPLFVSAKTGFNIERLKERIVSLAVRRAPERRLVGDLINPLDFVILVTPIDESAPKGRLILPQQQTIRDILDTGATAVVVKDTEYRETLESLGKNQNL